MGLSTKARKSCRSCRAARRRQQRRIRRPRLHQVLRLHQYLPRCCSCVDLGKKSCSRLGHGIRRDRVRSRQQRTTPAPCRCQSQSPGRAARASACTTATPPPARQLLPGTPEGTWGRSPGAKPRPGEPTQRGWGRDRDPGHERAQCATRVCERRGHAARGRSWKRGVGTKPESAALAGAGPLERGGGT